MARIIRFLCCLLLLAPTARVNAQTNPAPLFEWVWAEGRDTTGQMVRTGAWPHPADVVALDGAGNYYLAGSYNTFSQLPIPVPPVGPWPAQDAYLVSLTPQGQVRWFLTLRSSGTEEPIELTVAPSGDVLMLGVARDSLLINNQPISSLGSSWPRYGGAFLLRVSPTGQPLGVQPFGVGYNGWHLRSRRGWGLRHDAAGNLLVCLPADGNVTVAPGTVLSHPSPQAGALSTLLAYDAAGNYRWGHFTSRETGLHDVETDARGNIWLMGVSDSLHAARLGGQLLVPGQLVPTTPSTYVSRLDANGQVRGGYYANSGGVSWPYRLHPLPGGDQLITFLTQAAAVEIGGQLVTLPPDSAYRTLVARLDSTGHARWVRPLPGLSQFTQGGLAVIADEVYVTGNAYAADSLFGGLPYPAGEVGVGYIVALDLTTGAPRWLQTHGAIGVLSNDALSLTPMPGGLLLHVMVANPGRHAAVHVPPMYVLSSDTYLAKLSLQRVNGLAAGRVEVTAGCWPNPVRAGQLLHLAPGAGAVSLTDAVGRVVRAAPPGATTIPTAGLTPGLYVLRVGSRAQRVVVGE